jgi:hypothetical protein
MVMLGGRVTSLFTNTGAATEGVALVIINGVMMLLVVCAVARDVPNVSIVNNIIDTMAGFGIETFPIALKTITLEDFTIRMDEEKIDTVLRITCSSDLRPDTRDINKMLDVKFAHMVPPLL